MNWGKGIIIALIAFIGFITTLAVFMMKANTQLVSEDYYLQEIEFGSEITAQSNALSDASSVKSEVSDAGVYLTIETPTSIEEGSIHLHRPNNKKLDVRQPLEGKHTFIDRTALESGKYRLTIDWFDGQKHYQLRKDLWIQ
ncbi:MAG: FixH family protein [Bacteroidota bacterium]